MSRVAAIDCGTNSIRLLIADKVDGGLQDVHREMRIVRLGQGVDATGQFAPDALARTKAALVDYAELLRSFTVPKVRMVATSAARDAANRDEFFDAAEAVLGVRPELLSGLEEGRLSFRGATSELDPASGPFLVFDIGAGSTEISYGTTEVEATISTDMGCVRITEAWLHGDPPTAEELSQAISIIEIHLDDVLREIPDAPDAATFVGLAGTVSATAAVELGLATYDRDRIHHFRLTKPAVEDVFRTLATEALADRIHNPGLERERADVIVGGLCVLVSIMRRFHFRECLVSESDILDGLAMSIAGDA